MFVYNPGGTSSLVLSTPLGSLTLVVKMSFRGYTRWKEAIQWCCMIIVATPYNQHCIMIHCM